MNKKIRIAEKQKVPIIAIIGNKELENRSVAVRDRRKKTDSKESLQYDISIQDFLKEVSILNREVIFWVKKKRWLMNKFDLIQ